LESLITLFKINILSKLVPDFNKEGYEHGTNVETTEQPTSSTSTSSTSRQPRYTPYNPEDDDPLRIGPIRRGPTPSSLIDPYGHGQVVNPPFSIGSQDLYPNFNSGLPPSRGMGGLNSPFSGNVIGPSHPGFGPFVNDPYGGGMGNFTNPPSGRGRGTGGRVPGARFDPYGPPINDLNSEPGNEPPPPGFDNMFL